MTHSVMYHTIFAAPKQGGVLQSSGFLDLRGLISLSRTAKAHAFDELSLIMLIENEITRRHDIQTMEKAITFLRYLYCERPLLRQWLERDSRSSTDVADDGSMIVIPTQEMLNTAAPYDVMLAKMLHTIPDSQLLQACMTDQFGRTLLHRVATSGNPESIKHVLNIYPVHLHIQVLNVRDMQGETVLHHVAGSRNPESIQTILDIYPEASQRLQAVKAQSIDNETVLHIAARSGNIDSVKAILAVYPTSEHLRAVCTQDRYNATVLHCAARSGNPECVREVLSCYPEPERVQAICTPDQFKATILHYAAASSSSIHYILDLLPESHLLHALEMQTNIGETVLHIAADLGHSESLKEILALFPESQRLRVLSLQTEDGKTVLHYAANLGHFQSVCHILEALPETQRRQVVNLQDEDGRTCLDLVQDEEARRCIMELLIPQKL